jgi:hypothetical protein
VCSIPGVTYFDPSILKRKKIAWWQEAGSISQISETQMVKNIKPSKKKTDKVRAERFIQNIRDSLDKQITRE